MRSYELMLVVRPEFDYENAQKRQELVEKLVGEGATVSEVNLLGKKQLAYLIEKQKEAVYLLAEVKAEALKNDEIDKRARLNEAVLRYLLTVKQ